MPLDPDKVRSLLAIKAAKAAGRGKSRTGSGSKRKADPKDRSIRAWFAADHIMDEGTYCTNPNCIDPRDKGRFQTVVEVETEKMCRFCFLGDWNLENSKQTELVI